MLLGDWTARPNLCIGAWLSAVAGGVALLAPGHGLGAVVPSAQIPATSATAAGFAPAGWQVEKRVRGNLDGDGRTDLAIVLVQSASGGGAYGAPDGSRALVLARGRVSGGFRRSGIAPRLLGCGQCGGAFWGAARMPVKVTISKRAVLVRQTFGSRELTDTTHRIRWDAAPARFRLIGLDTVVTDRLTGRSVSVTTNHLTRRQTTITRKGTKIVSTTRRTVRVVPRPIVGVIFGKLRP